MSGAGADIVITGIGLVTPLGDSLDAVNAAVMAGRCALVPASESALIGSAASRIVDFDSSRYANLRGMRVYNRTTRLGISAATLALADAKLDADGAVVSEDLGLIMASTFGHLDTLMEYDGSLVTAGLQRTNPALMPLALPSAPGAAVALSFAAKAFSISLADDAVSSLDALALGARLLRAGRARVCLVVAAFAPFFELSLAALRAGFLDGGAAGAGPRGFARIFARVFDRRHAGAAFAEAGVAMVLERAGDAVARGATGHGTVAGWASTFSATAGTRVSALTRACALASAAAGTAPVDLALVSAGANGVPATDDAEALALRQFLGAAAATTPVLAPKANLGDPLDAGGLWQVAAALGALRTGHAPAIVGLTDPAIPGLHYLREPASVRGTHALVTAFSSTGSAAAIVLGYPHASN